MTHARLSRRKKMLFACLVTGALLGIAEWILALAGLEPLSRRQGDPFVGFAPGVPLLTPAPENPELLTTSPRKRAHFNVQTIAREKPASSIRILCLGGSTTYGRPLGDATSYCGWLREILPRAAPGRHWELLNAGGISYASYRVAALLEELAELRPDLVIVYTGHNEFLEERSYGSLQRTPAAVLQAQNWLSHSRIYSALHARAHRAERAPAFRNLQLPAEVDTILEHSVGPESYVRDDRLRREIESHFAWNLQRLPTICRAVGARLLLITPASNLKDCSPFKDQPEDAADGEFRRLLDAAGEHLAHDRPERAWESSSAAAARSPRSAAAQYVAGRSALALRRWKDAERHFQRAIDEDVCSLRATTALVDEVRRTAAKKDIPLLDFQRRLADTCEAEWGHRCPGSEYFFDHVHPTVEMHGQLALWLAPLVLEQAGVAATSQSCKEAHRAATPLILSRVDRRAEAESLRNLAKVLNWAGKHEEAGRLALLAADRLPDDAECQMLAAYACQHEGRIDEAVRRASRAVELDGSLLEARRLLGPLLVQQGRLDEALPHFALLTKQDRHSLLAWQTLGGIHLERQRPREALACFVEAERLQPDAPHLQYHLGLCSQHLGDDAAAERHYRTALSQNALDHDARYNLALLLNRTARTAEAVEQLEALLERAPGDAQARQTLAKIKRPKSPQ